ncbi:MAG: DUF72 domain-containing protein [Candidatus Latescibacteria bacterium]|nr:DUF72 domain-containing protein [Candidatus Latescibacterota bacterium]
MGEQQDLFAQLLPKPGLRDVEKLQTVQQGLPHQLYLGTTSWTYEDWHGLIYPLNCSPKTYLEHYAHLFRTVEIDSTWYRVPTSNSVQNWLARTPDRFRFAAKVPRVITHEKGMVDCRDDIAEFTAAMAPLQPRTSALLMQFGYVARGSDAREHETGDDFLRRLEAFLPELPTDQFRFALEVRNARWLRPALMDLLRTHGIALALTSYYTMPEIGPLLQGPDPITADFLYIRFLGDRKKMDEYIAQLQQKGSKQKAWDGLVWDRRPQLAHWVGHLKNLLEQRPQLQAHVFFNNHYAGYAPGSLSIFSRLWKGHRGGVPTPPGQ